MFSTNSSKKRVTRLWWFPSVEMLIFIVVFTLSLYLMPRLINGDGDLGRHITIGNVLLDTGEILRNDIFSHTMLGEDLVLHEWLSDLIFAQIYRLSGMNGIAWLTALILAATYALFTAGLKALDIRTPIRLFAGTVAFLIGAIHWHTRPHIITTFLFTYLIIILFSYYKTENRKLLYPLPFVMLLWANLHGAFVSGLVQIALFAIGLLLEKKFAAAKEIAILLFVSFLASLVNPFGLQMITHSFGYLQLDYLVDFTNEYNSPNFHHAITWPFLGILLLTIIAGWRSKNKIGWVPLVFLFFWTASSLYSARNIPLYGQIAVLFLASHADQSISELFPKISRFLSLSDKAGKRSWGWMWGISFAAFLIFLQANGGIFDMRDLGNNFDPDRFPIHAIESLEEKGFPEGNVFNEFMWGGYLLERVWPQKLVFIDGQTDFYGEDLTRIHEKTINGQGDWQSVLDQYEITWVILPPERTLAKLLSFSEEWEQIYHDDTALVFLRR